MSSSRLAGYDYFEVEADVGVRAWGPRVNDAFAQAAVAVFALMVDPAEVESAETREVRAQAETREDLLATWINECLYVHDIEGFVVRDVEVDLCEERVVHGVLHGEPFDQRRHRPGTLVKAATLHRISVTQVDGQWEARLVVDV